MLDVKTIGHASGQFDNHAAEYRHIRVVPLAAAMGAEIQGVDCAAVTDEQFDEVEHALFRHKMIYFRGQQHMTHGDQSAFSRRFGPFAEDAYTQGVPGFPEVQPLIKEADERTGFIFGSGWHTDSPFMPEPPAISTLRAIEIPPFGGDTIWCNSALAYATLSDGMKALLEPLKIHMSIVNVLHGAQTYGTPGDGVIGQIARNKDVPPSDAMLAKIAGACHPLVRTHPVTGEKALYCDASYSVGIEGLKAEEAAPILNYMVNYITQASFSCRLRWEVGTWALWDNRLCLHQAFNDYDGFRRELYRTTLAGERPR